MSGYCEACEIEQKSPGVRACPYCGDELSRKDDISSAVTLETEAIDAPAEDQLTAASIVADALDDQEWGPDGLDPIDEARFLASLPLMLTLGLEDIEGAVGQLRSGVPRDTARALLGRRLGSFDAKEWKAPAVWVEIDAPPGAAVFMLRAVVRDIRPKRARAERIRVDLELPPGVESKVEGNSLKGPAASGVAIFKYRVGSREGAKTIGAAIRVTLSREGQVDRVYEAPFVATIDQKVQSIVTQINNYDGVVRYNQQIALDGAAKAAAMAPARSTELKNEDGVLRANLVGGGDLKADNRGGKMVIDEQAGAVGAASRRRSEPTPSEPLLVVPDLTATVKAAIAAELTLRLQTTDGPWVGEGSPVHNALLWWTDADGLFHAGFLVGNKRVVLGRHHMQADLPVRPCRQVSVLAISRRAVEVWWVRNDPRVVKIGNSTVRIDSVELTDQNIPIPAAAEMLWTCHADLDVRWEVSVLDGDKGDRRPVRWMEPEVPNRGTVCHVVAPDGGYIGGGRSLFRLPTRSGREVGLERRGRKWYVRGLEGGGLQLDGSPCIHPELRYGLKDGAVIQLPCNTRLVYRVARSAPGEDWELRGELESGQTPQLSDLLAHVVHS